MASVIGRDPFTERCIQVDVDGERISSVIETTADTDFWISSGFVDLQVNGYLGIDLNSEQLSGNEVLRLARVLAKGGTTTFLPTIITANRQSMAGRLKVLASAISSYEEVRHACPGIHLEGPWISPLDGYRGAHPFADVRSPSIEEFDELQSAADGRIQLVTLSPHWPNSGQVIRALCERGVVVSLGHTHASPTQIREACDAGAQLSTHLGNGIAAELVRHPNPIWTQLAEDRLTAMLIADGVHLSDDVLRVMLRSKGIDRAILVSDAVALAGSEPGQYASHIGGSVTVHADGTIRMSNSDLLAGSGILLKDAVGRAANRGGCSLNEALRMATQNPAAVLGLQIPSLSSGAVANLVRFRWTPGASGVDIIDVMVRGKLLT